jgi:hypothetical protein
MRALTCTIRLITELDNKAVVCALSASYISTFAGYPVRGGVAMVVSTYLLVLAWLVGLSQVPVANNENPDFRSSNRPACLP